MAIPRPTKPDFQALAASLGIHASASELDELLELTMVFASAFDGIESIPEPERPPVPVREHQRPSAADNPLGAWVYRTSVREKDDGRLSGRSVVLKDNVALAGVPMSGGTAFLEDFVPEEDATVTRRLLDAGAEIVGKATCEYLSASAGSHTSACAPVVRNPLNPAHTTGGSSSGCAALVASGEVGLAIGGDQGGSVRLPSSFCGIVGMKPTHGLVPYTGILSIDAHIDHTGPMTGTVADNALLLEVIAGPDGVDTRQLHARTGDYVGAASRAPDGMRVSVLEEGFGDADPAVDRCVREAATRLEKHGVHVERIAVPEHPVLGAAMVPLLVLGSFELLRGGGFATHANMPVAFGLPEASEGFREHADTMPINVKTMMLAAALADRAGGRLRYAKALRLRDRARAVYDRALQDYDALLMPTTPITAPPLPRADATTPERLAAGSAGIANTAQFDVSGHPAISVPCGEAHGLPVGCMLVGQHWDEASLYRLASGVESR